MSELLLQIGATKLVVSVLLAGVVWVVHRRVGRPGVSYHMWLLVLVVLLVPAVVSLPVLPADSESPVAVSGAELPGDAVPVTVAAGETAGERSANRSNILTWAVHLWPGLAVVWLLGTAGIIGWTGFRAVRFRRWVTGASRPAPPAIRREAVDVGRALGLARMPEIHITRARMSPMVWWLGGKVRLLIPSAVVDRLSQEDTRAVLAHELAHIRRRDHVVRWVEWMTCTVFWWNPVAWWARRQLRVAEECCCDEIALASAGSNPRGYAHALVRVLDLVSSTPDRRAPAVASLIGRPRGTRVLERRLKVILAPGKTSPTPPWLRHAAGAVFVCALPFGLIYCDQAVTPAGVAATVPEADAETETRQASLEEILTRREEELDARVLGLVEQGKVSEGQGEVLRFEVSGYSAGITIALREQETRLPDRLALADRYVEWVEGRMADAVGRPDGEVPAVDDQSERMSGHARVAYVSGWSFMFAAREASRMVDAMGLVSALERPGNGLTLGKSVDEPPSTELRGLRAVRR
ncbi:MAG: M56 family metallopeptidase [Gemmatimonadota bacterium]|nr:M56 family metallopeptidase [Gemmatimonadota bacterium]